ncbi:hypothetical protein ABPG72_015452 [Tetrahymena utriculariae]
MTEIISFGADIQQLLQFFINSIYTNKEIFLRELISNSSDAINKKIIQQTDFIPKILINTDIEKRTLFLSDNGIGMDKEEIKKNIGTIASSHTKLQREKIEELIGQFGVGFYSVYLVADKVSILTRKQLGDKLVFWESYSNQQSYSLTCVEEQKEQEEEEYGYEMQMKQMIKYFYNHHRKDSSATLIALRIKNNCSEYLTNERINSIIKKHSDFIQFPIYNGSNKINSQTPLWCRNKEEIQEEDYRQLYKSITATQLNPETDYFSHQFINTEGNLNFKCIFFIPKKQNFNFDNQQIIKGNVKLYVKKVFITDELEIFPDYLNFIKCVIDSDDLPLNISREFIQQNKIIAQIKKVILKKVFQQFNVSDDQFYFQYSKNLKLGICSDDDHKQQLSNLLKFKSVKQKQITLQQYCDNLKPEQKEIFFYCGNDPESPLINGLLQKDYDVLLFDEPIDEHMIQVLRDYQGKELINCGRIGCGKFFEDKQDQEKQKKIKEIIQKKHNYLEDVQFSSQSGCYPGAVVVGQYGWTCGMEKIMNQQVLSDNQMFEHMKPKKYFLVNPLYLPTDENKIIFLYETVLLHSGFQLEDMSSYVKNVIKLL